MGGLKLPRSLWVQMQQHVQAQAPEEACGLLAGHGDTVERAYVVTNALHSPVRFQMDPQEQLSAFFEMERCGQELLAIYHSHPQGPAMPSPTDQAEFAYPGCLYLIWVPGPVDWACQAFALSAEGVALGSLTICE